MKTFLTMTMLLFTTITAQANSVEGVPSFIVECPGKVLVQADQDGPIMIGSQEADTKQIKDRHFEAKGDGVTLSIRLEDDDSVAVSSTGKAPNGVCQSVDD